MAYFKDNLEGLYFLSEEDIRNGGMSLLPEECQPITDIEATELQIRTPTAAETLSENTSIRDLMLTRAGLAIAPLQDAVDLEDATADEAALLKKWKQHRVAVNRIDLTSSPALWPDQPA